MTAAAFHRSHQLDTRGMSASAYFEILKKQCNLFPRSYLYFLTGWRWSSLAFIPTPSGGTESSCPAVRGTSLREKAAAMRECKGWSPMVKSSSQTLHQRAWNRKNFSGRTGGHGHCPCATREEHLRAWLLTPSIHHSNCTPACCPPSHEKSSFQ